MDRRSSASGSSMSSTSRDEFKDLLSFYRNYIAGQKGESLDLARDKADKFVGAIKLLGFRHQQLIMWVKQKDASGNGPNFAGQQLWTKLSEYQKLHPHAMQISKSEMVNATIKYVRDIDSRAKQSQVVDVVDLEEESDSDQATNDFHNHFSRVLSSKIRSQNPNVSTVAVNSVVDSVRKLVQEKVGFQVKKKKNKKT